VQEIEDQIDEAIRAHYALAQQRAAARAHAELVRKVYAAARKYDDAHAQRTAVPRATTET
jgi:hypothetical protein